jgi:hypothetical protein
LSKKYRGKICVYCCKCISETADHVFAKEFFLLDKRANLPKVPACNKCNNQKSELEHYLAALLPFGGRHADAHINLVEMVPKRLGKNAKLHRRLAAGRRNVWSREAGGLYVRSLALPIDGDRLLELFRFITKGLLWYHWGVMLKPEHFVEAIALTATGDRYFANLLSRKARSRVSEDLGAGTFRYAGAQGTDQPETSIWIFSIYQGVKFTEDREETAGASINIGALTGNSRILENARRSIATRITT